MHYLYCPVSVFLSDVYLGAAPIERSTYVSMLVYCVLVENSGRIRGCRAWTNRKWEQVVHCSKEEAEAPSELWRWEGDDVVISYYPIDQQLKMERAREKGRLGAETRWNDRGEKAAAVGDSAPAAAPAGVLPVTAPPGHGVPTGVPIRVPNGDPIGGTNATPNADRLIDGIDGIDVPDKPTNGCGGGKRLHGIPATAEEVVAYGKTLNPPKPEAVCREFWAYYEGQARVNAHGETFWITSGDAVVTNWRVKLSAFGGLHDKSKAGGPHSSRNAGTANENRASDYANYPKLLPKFSNSQ